MSKEQQTIDLDNTWLKPFSGEEISATALIEKSQKRTKKMIESYKKKEKTNNLFFFLMLVGGIGFGITYVIQGFAWFHAIILAIFAFNGWSFRRTAKQYAQIRKELTESSENLAKRLA